MYRITESTASPFIKELVGLFPTYGEAVNHALTSYDVAFFEADRDVDYDAADFVTNDGRLFQVEPCVMPKAVRHG